MYRAAVSPTLVIACLDRLIRRRVSDGVLLSPDMDARVWSGDIPDGAGTILTSCADRYALTPTEYRLFKRLLCNHNGVVARQDLAKTAWPQGNSVKVTTIDGDISRLRRKLAVLAAHNLIRTVKGRGYVLTDR